MPTSRHRGTGHRKNRVSRTSRSSKTRTTAQHAQFAHKKIKRLVRKKFTWKKLISYGVIFCILLFSFITIYAAWISRDLPDPNKLGNRQVAESTKIYDKTGEHLLYEIFSEKKRTIVELEDIPSYAVNAAIAVEDSKFYEHKGVRFTSIIRAAISNFLHLDSGRGGASTLTQQLVKNAIVGTEKSINRKIKEAILSLQLERKYTKQEILKLYFNEIPYGSTNYGIESASQAYFGKSSHDINLPEAATLAGMVQAPTFYLNNIDEMQERRDFVISRMYSEGYITADQKTKAQAEPLELKERLTGIDAPHFVLHVKELLTEQFGEKVVETGGLKVMTPLDFDLHTAAEKSITTFLDKASDLYNIGNAALTAIDPSNGQVLVMIGSKDFFDEETDGQVNVAMRSRQPGSSFKPFVYTAGFEKEYTPDTILYDVVTNFDSRTEDSYTPHNYDQKERGPITVRKALQGSLNIPAVKMLYLVGVDDMVSFAGRFGYTTLQDRDRFGLSMVLGGAEVKLLEHTNAYATLANEGVYHEPTFILSVEDKDGEELFEWDEKKHRAIDKEHTYTISNILSDDNARSYMFGSGSNLTLPGRQVAAKTGTTNDYRDGWTLGYTPQLAAGVWAGNNDNTPMNGAGGSIAAAPIWNGFMQKALAGKPVESFPEAPENKSKKPVLRGTDSGKITLLVDKISGKLATSSTPEEFIEERTYLQPHSILHYVKKDNPNGSEPKNPEDDAQYNEWENAVQTWIDKLVESGEKVVLDLPPTEKDDVHDEKLAPKINFTFPSNNAVFDSRNIIAKIQASAPRGIAKVKYFIDDEQVYTTNSYPFELTYYARELENKKHKLTARAYDDKGNVGYSNEINFTLDAPPPPSEITWSSPKNGASFYASSFPLTIGFNVFQPSKINDITAISTKDGTQKTIFTTSEPEEQKHFKWSESEKGDYILSFITSDKTQSQTITESITVTIK